MQNLTVGHVILIVLLGLVLALFGPFVLGALLGYASMDVAIRGLGAVINYFINPWRDE